MRTEILSRLALALEEAGIRPGPAYEPQYFEAETDVDPVSETWSPPAFALPAMDAIQAALAG